MTTERYSIQITSASPLVVRAVRHDGKILVYSEMLVESVSLVVKSDGESYSCDGLICEGGQ